MSDAKTPPKSKTKKTSSGRNHPATPEELDQRIRTELVRQHGILNRSHWKGALRPVVIALRPDLGKPAGWFRRARVICFDERFARHEHWGHVLDVLAQKMAHQYVDEVRGLPDDPAHTAAYLRECQAQGLASGLKGREALGDEAQRALKRVTQLLALAESPNRHEAEMAMAEAQRLMLKHNLLVTPAVPDPAADYQARCIGEHKGLHSPYERVLGQILRDHFFVRICWRWLYDPRNGLRGRALEIFGTQTNMELASYVYDFLHRTGERLFVEYRKEKELTGNKDRRAFMLGVMGGFYAKLNEEKSKNAAQGLVWLGDKGLKEFDDKRYPVRVHSHRREQPWNEARSDGWKAGKKISLHMPVGSGRGKDPAGSLPG